MTAFEILLWLGVALALYSYVRARTATVIQPIRLEVLDRAQSLIRRGDFPETKKRTLNFLLDNMYSTKTAWMFALGVFPMAVYFTCKRMLRQGTVSKANFPHKKEYGQILRTGVLCMVASSPAAFLVFAFASVLTELLRIPSSVGVSKILDSAKKAREDDYSHSVRA